jgi:hypothetical protein
LWAASGASPAPGRAAQVGVAQTGEARDRRRQRDAGVDERLERLGDLERADADGADLAHAVARRREARRLEVEDDELGVLDEGLRRLPAGQADAPAEPGEPRVAVDDVGEQGVRERRRGALEREEDARGLLRPDRAPPRVDELDEAVGGVEGELHRAPP